VQDFKIPLELTKWQSTSDGLRGILTKNLN